MLIRVYVGGIRFYEGDGFVTYFIEVLHEDVVGLFLG